MDDKPHIFVCPECRGMDYHAEMVDETVEEKWTGEYANVHEVEICRYYNCICNDCNHEWEDYECEHK